MNAHAKVAEPEVSTDVALVVPPETALAVLTSAEKFDAFYSKVKAETDTLVADVKTPKGRDAIKSMAFKVVKTKTAIDAAGKLLTEEWRTQTATVDASRKAIRDKLDALRDEVRKPLTDWEEAEEARIQEVGERLRAIEHAATVWPDDNAGTVAARIAELEALELPRALYEENLPLAASARDNALITLRSMHTRLVQEEADRIELERLRSEAAERERIEAAAREDQARAEAAAVAARIEREAEERRQADEAARVQRETDARETAAREAAATAQAETERRAREEQEARDNAHQAEVARLNREAAERDASEEAAEQARAAEARRLEAEAETQRRADEARAADRKHRGEIMGDAKADIIEASGVTDEQARVIVLAIAGGSVRHTAIRF